MSYDPQARTVDGVPEIELALSNSRVVGDAKCEAARAMEANFERRRQDFRNKEKAEMATECAAPPSKQPDLSKFVTTDSGERDQFDTGCQRDKSSGKGRFDLIPARPLRRLAGLYERGAEKYDDNNWRKGMPFLRVIESLERHIGQYKEALVLDPDGMDNEDHLAAVAWNAFTLMEYEEALRAGQLPAKLDNRYRYPLQQKAN